MYDYNDNDKTTVKCLHTYVILLFLDKKTADKN